MRSLADSPRFVSLPILIAARPCEALPDHLTSVLSFSISNLSWLVTSTPSRSPSSRFISFACSCLANASLSVSTHVNAVPFRLQSRHGQSSPMLFKPSFSISSLCLAFPFHRSWRPSDSSPALICTHLILFDSLRGPAPKFGAYPSRFYLFVAVALHSCSGAFFVCAIRCQFFSFPFSPLPRHFF